MKHENVSHFYLKLRKVKAKAKWIEIELEQIQDGNCLSTLNIWKPLLDWNLAVKSSETAEVFLELSPGLGLACPRSLKSKVSHCSFMWTASSTSFPRVFMNRHSMWYSFQSWTIPPLQTNHQSGIKFHISSSIHFLIHNFSSSIKWCFVFSKTLYSPPKVTWVTHLGAPDRSFEIVISILSILRKWEEMKTKIYVQWC